MVYQCCHNQLKGASYILPTNRTGELHLDGDNGSMKEWAVSLLQIRKDTTVRLIVLPFDASLSAFGEVSGVVIGEGSPGMGWINTSNMLKSEDKHLPLRGDLALLALLVNTSLDSPNKR